MNIIHTAQFFKGIDRIKLMKSLFENSVNDQPAGAGLHLDKMVHQGCLAAAFALHDYNELVDLQEKWLVLWQWPSQQPFDDIKNYFGEKLGLYYVFLGHYTNYLGYPAVGIIFVFFYFSLILFLFLVANTNTASFFYYFLIALL